jgi:hypothetical protein
VNTDEVETGYAWPNTGCVNAARVKLALWDAFHGTAQPTLPGYPVDTTGATLYGSTARMFIDETGWQVDTAGRSTTGLDAYADSENVQTIDEATQAEDYGKLVHLANCEPTLTTFDIFHEIDESDRAGFQSGVLRADSSMRPAALSLPSSILSDNGSCSRGVWQTLGDFLYSTSAVVPRYQAFPYQARQPFAATTLGGGAKYVALSSGEGFTYAITFKRGSRRAAYAHGAAPRTMTTVKIPLGFGSGTATIVLRAETNHARTSKVTLVLSKRH